MLNVSTFTSALSSSRNSSPFPGRILPDRADNGGFPTQGGDISGHIGGPARHFLVVFVDFYHGDRGLGRNASHLPLDINIQHHVADDTTFLVLQDADTGPSNSVWSTEERMDFFFMSGEHRRFDELAENVAHQHVAFLDPVGSGSGNDDGDIDFLCDFAPVAA